MDLKHFQQKGHVASQSAPWVWNGVTPFEFRRYTLLFGCHVRDGDINQRQIRTKCFVKQKSWLAQSMITFARAVTEAATWASCDSKVLKANFKPRRLFYCSAPVEPASGHATMSGPTPSCRPQRLLGWSCQHIYIIWKIKPCTCKYNQWNHKWLIKSTAPLITPGVTWPTVTIQELIRDESG